MKKQFGVIHAGPGTWHIVSLHGSGNVLGCGVTISDHTTRTDAIAVVREYVDSHLAIWPKDTVIVEIGPRLS